jgi:hypothetical protein
VLEDAKRAIAELKLAVPGADWEAIEARTAGLVAAPLSRRRRNRLAVASVTGVFLLAVLAWLLALVPEHHARRGEAMRRELAQIKVDRKVKIDELSARIGLRCDPNDAHELVKLLVLDGRGPDAKAFGEDYVLRCGDDPVVEHWANAPRPGH